MIDPLSYLPYSRPKFCRKVQNVACIQPFLPTSRNVFLLASSLEPAEKIQTIDIRSRRRMLCAWSMLAYQKLMQCRGGEHSAYDILRIPVPGVRTNTPSSGLNRAHHAVLNTGVHSAHIGESCIHHHRRETGKSYYCCCKGCSPSRRRIRHGFTVFLLFFSHLASDCNREVLQLLV